MESRLSGASLAGWRMRRPGARDRSRPLRAAVVGDDEAAIEIARRLCRLPSGHVIVSAGSPAAAARVAEALEGRAEVTVQLQKAAPLDLLILRPPEGSGRIPWLRDLALWAARTCPLTVLLLAVTDGLALSYEAAQASGLAPPLILSPGAMPRAAAEVARLSARHGVCASQIAVPVVGGEGFATTRPLMRYATIGGIPADHLEPAAPERSPGIRPDRAATEEAIVACTLAIARAVLEDRRQILSCSGWVEGAHGLTGAFVSVPLPVGARGAEEPLPLRLTLEEKSLLQRVAVRD